MYFPVNFAKFLRTDFLQNTHGRSSVDLLLKGHSEDFANESKCRCLGFQFNKTFLDVQELDSS